MTTSSIRDLLRVLIDEPTTARWSNANLNTLIFSEYREIVNKIVERNPKYYTKSGTVTTTASTEFTDLPSDCIVLNKLKNDEDNIVRWIDSAQFDHSASSSEPTRFDVVGRKIWWSPIPDTTYSFTAYYHYKPTDMSLETSVPELPPNFHDILAYGVAVNSRLAKDDNIRDYAMIYQDKLSTLLHQVSISQTNNAPRVKRAYDASEL